ncbi:hypothetical protein LVJ94_11290 [Pendulispora rubella]|uniref:AsmA domain-containing protein n=2 Tax=Pendulispora rubella TaxID=2741070 RepID=A0ABZ2LF66_9BACT
MRRAILVVGAVVAVAILAVFFAVPEIARRRAISDAKARGVTFTIAKARLTGSGVRFFDLEARLDKVPGAVAHAKEANVELSGLSPRELTLQGLDVSIPDLLAALPQLEAQRATGTAIENDLQRIVFKDALVHLARFAGESTSLEVAGATAEIGDETHLRADKVTGTLGASPFGPWKVVVDREREMLTTRIAMDPSKPEVPQVSIGQTPSATNLDINAPRTHLRALGLPFSAFGLAADEDPEIEVDASSMSTNGESAGAMLFQSWGAHVGPFPNPIDVKVGGKWKGQGESLAVRDGVFQVGPFGGSLRGNVRSGLAPRLDFAFDSEPIPCGDFASQAAQPGLIGAILQRKTTAVTGTVVLTGSLVFDASNPAENRLDVKPSADCSFTLR